LVLLFFAFGVEAGRPEFAVLGGSPSDESTSATGFGGAAAAWGFAAAPVVFLGAEISSVKSARLNTREPPDSV